MENKEIILAYLQEDLDEVIQEAKLIAIQRVKEKLVVSLEGILYDQALIQMKNDFSLRNGIRESAELHRNESDQPLNIQEKKNIYLFGITEAEGEETLISPNSLEGMTDGEYVYVLRHKELIAVICQVPQEEFNEVKMQELTENRDWLGEKAERHQRVIAGLAEKHPIVPMGFCVLYATQGQLKIFMEENYHDLQDLLKKIVNKTEWGLKLYLDENRFKKYLQEKDQNINNLIDEMSLNQKGRGYLPKKRLANSIERKAFDLAEEVHRRLCRFSAEAVVNKLLPQEVTGRQEKMILNGAYLLDKTQEEDFFQTVRWLEETEEPRGFIFEVSGPWPCYNFCRISSTST